jgi:DNA-directed RNA polymerase subunit RPC12/RpoP
MIIRTYECMECSALFEVTLDSGNDGDPPCPNCDKVLEWRPTSFNISSNKGKAVDIAQEIIEQDYGMTNFKDGSREGDVAAITPVETTVDREKREMAIMEAHQAVAAQAPPLPPAQADMVKGFFGAPGGGGSLNLATIRAGASVGPAANVNPMQQLHEAGRKGMLPMNYRIIARA